LSTLPEVLVQRARHPLALAFAGLHQVRGDAPVGLGGAPLGDVGERQAQRRAGGRLEHAQRVGLDVARRHVVAVQRHLDAAATPGAIQVGQVVAPAAPLAAVQHGGECPPEQVLARLAQQRGPCQVQIEDAPGLVQGEVAHGRQLEQVLVAVTRGGKLQLRAQQLLVLLLQFDLVRAQFACELYGVGQQRGGH
jgi:hypothetical protein